MFCFAQMQQGTPKECPSIGINGHVPESQCHGAILSLSLTSAHQPAAMASAAPPLPRVRRTRTSKIQIVPEFHSQRDSLTLPTLALQGPSIPY